MKRIFLFLGIILCSLSVIAQSTWLFNRGDSISWLPSQDMTITFEKDPVGFFWQNIQTRSLDVVRMPIYTGDKIELKDTPFLQVEKKRYEVTNSSTFIDIKLKTNIADWTTITVQPQVDWIRLSKTDDYYFPVIKYRFQYDRNNTSKNHDGIIIFNYSDANISDTVRITSIAGNPDPDRKERAVLMNFYSVSGGDNWTNNTNWGSDEPLEEWYGITTRNGHVVKIELGGNNLNGDIAEMIDTISNLSSLETLWLTVNKGITGSIPPSVGKLNNLHELCLFDNLISGEIPDEVTNLVNLRDLNLCFNNLTGSIPQRIGNLKNLTHLSFRDNAMTGTLPVSLGQLSHLEGLELDYNTFSGNLPEELGNLSDLNNLYLGFNHLIGGIPSSFANLNNLKVLALNNNNMDGEVAQEVINSSMWKNATLYLAQNEGFGLKYDEYKSTDYTEDGKVILINQHSKGNGIKMVLIGDAYSDRLIADGTYRMMANKIYNALFNVEPYNTLRDYFDIYLVNAVSETEMPGNRTACQTQANEGYVLSYSDEKLIKYVKKIPELSASLENVTTILFLNCTDFYPGRDNATQYSDGYSIAVCKAYKNQDMMYHTERTIIHEVGGHCIGHLADEYDSDNAALYFPEELHASLDQAHINGSHLNVDYHDNPETVLWKDFLADPSYEIEHLGLFEGAMANYSKGIYRPNENSVMRNHMNGDDFNAPSRWAIYQWVMKYAGEEYKFEDFLAHDKKYLETMHRNDARAKASSTRRVYDIRDVQQFGAKPIIYNYPSSEIGKHK